MSTSSQNVVAAQQPASKQDFIKEELFHLESDRLHNKISADDYAKAKAALDLLMLRVASRKT